jgi:hypothetical protein
MLCSPSTKMLRKSMLCSPSTKMPGQYVFVTAGPIIKLTLCVCVYYCSTYYKAVRVGEGDSGGHVLRKTTSRGLSGLVCPSCTSERGGEGDCVKEGRGGEGEREKERALGLTHPSTLRCPSFASSYHDHYYEPPANFFSRRITPQDLCC